jgi:hypothetical protein
MAGTGKFDDADYTMPASRRSAFARSPGRSGCASSRTRTNFPTKQALLAALFADGFADLRAVLEGLPISRESIGASSWLPRPPSRTAPRTRPAST